jgi:hypothetical protein
VVGANRCFSPTTHIFVRDKAIEGKHMPSEYPLAQRQTTTSTADWAMRELSTWGDLGGGDREWSFPVLPEPPFQPLFVAPPKIIDDGRKHSCWSALAERFSNWMSGKTTEIIAPEPVADFNWLAFPDCGAPIEFQVLVPQKLNIAANIIEQFLANLSYCQLPMCLELIATHESISIQLSVHEVDADLIETQLRAYFPEVVFFRREGYLEQVWLNEGGGCPVYLDFGLTRDFVIPITGAGQLGLDPFVGICGALSNIRRGEVGVWQVLFDRARNNWNENILKYGEFVDGFAPYAKRKSSSALFSTVVRLAAQSSDEARSWQIAKNIAGAMSVFNDVHGNSFRPLKRESFSDVRHGVDLLLRRTHRSGILLNTDELLGLVHWPSPAVRAPLLERIVRKTKAAPDFTLNHSLILGINNHNGKDQTVTLAPDQRARHMHVIGASGTGKSTLLLNMIVQDIENGDGLAVLDPHGDLIESILARIPENRHADVVLVDPADEEFPVGFNILSAHSNLEKNLLASDLVSVFRRLSTSWGDVMTSVLGNAILAFLENPQGGTLSDLRRFLLEPGYRSEFLESVQDPEVVYYWKKEFPLLTGRPQASLLTRLDTFLRPKPIRHMVCQKENKLDFASIMDSKKIFLAKLSQGLIGHENSQLLGALFVSKFHQLVMGRQETREEKREYFWLYMDEFQDFVTPSMAAILSGARKYRLGLVLSHQDMQQIQSRDADVNRSILSNAHTRACFRLGDADARKLAEGLSTFDASDLQNLGTGEAVCRIERSAFDFNLKTAPIEPVDEKLAAGRREKIQELSRQRYGKPRSEVEARQAESATTPVEPERVPKDFDPDKLKRADGCIVTEQTATAKVIEMKATREEPPSVGKGGLKHQALQQLLKELADDLGLRATIEKPLPNREGSVDVDVQCGTQSVACEISITTSREHEVGNISKCLTAGYAHVLAVCPDRIRRAKLKKAAEAALTPDSLARVKFVTVVEAITFLQSLRPAKGSVAHSGGWDVRTRIVKTSESDAENRRKALHKMIENAAQRAGTENNASEKE